MGSHYLNGLVQKYRGFFNKILNGGTVGNNCPFLLKIGFTEKD